MGVVFRTKGVGLAGTQEAGESAPAVAGEPSGRTVGAFSMRAPPSRVMAIPGGRTIFLLLGSLFVFMAMPELVMAAGSTPATTLVMVRAQAEPKLILITPAVDKIGTPPACSQNSPNSTHRRSFTADPATPEGQAILSIALTAAATGQTVRVFGTGVCPIALDIEGVNFIVLEAN